MRFAEKECRGCSEAGGADGGLRCGSAGFSAFSTEELVGELFVSGCTEAGGFVLHDGFPVAWGFAESDGARDDRPIDDVLEMGLHFGDDRLGEVVPHEHGQQDSRDAEVGVGLAFSDLRHDAIDFREAFEGEVLALDRDKKFVGGGERIGHEYAEGGRAIEENVVEGGCFSQGFESDAKSGEMFSFASDFDFSAGEVDVAGDEPEVVAAGRDDAVLELAVSEEGFVDAEAFDGIVAESTCGVGLGVEIDKEDAVASGGDGRREVDGGRCFSDASFLVGHCDNFHSELECRRKCWFEKRSVGAWIVLAVGHAFVGRSVGVDSWGGGSFRSGAAAVGACLWEGVTGGVAE